MPRNHSRINQTSTSLIQSWRANCDVQILIYESHPDNFDLREVSKVTDYVVAYSSKASTTYREELNINCQLILGMEETTGDLSELKSLCKHISNKASASRLISKPEAAVLLGCHDLVECSDFIEPISISNNLRLSVSGDKNSNKSLLSQYANRSSLYENLSLHEFYPIFRSNVQGKKSYVPHYVGVKGHPTFPVSQGYARHVLIVYRPWRTYPALLQWQSEFQSFINSRRCPLSAKLTYKRVVQRYYDGTKFVEPTSSQPSQGNNLLSDSDEEALLLAGLGQLPVEAMHSYDLTSIKKGVDFLWSKPPTVSLQNTRIMINKRLQFSTCSKICI